MRYFLLLAAPALLLGAARPLRRPATPGPTHATAPLVAPGAVLSNATRTALLARASLGRLWQHQASNGTEDVLNGVFGYDGRRLEFVFLSVQADAKSPGRYLVAGKFRCYGDVTPFRGSVEVQQVQRLPAEAVGDDGTGKARAVYCATGSFALQATSSHGLGGRFDGRLGVDFQVGSSGRAALAEYTTNALTRRGGLLFDGEWRDGPDGDPVPAVWKQGMAVAHQVLTRFQIGDRDAHLNPRYARVGWNTYWQNDEWWAEKQVAKR
ncbi:hypothetical protein MON38_17305 [Hymenobacter sp. DH14]|uniref:Uncharacterized protein n=1 Tax=Hymenobacter cyanobacteriorum TaxID=2926463 RepID=A0A9X1VHC3_9BACT|nr:hypothetical protein [Hymenobacter cyanobacteriorum]MCI1189184.1 hypothetical protein [Hymenobacter cyanobacteriorum]